MAHDGEDAGPVETGESLWPAPGCRGARTAPGIGYGVASFVRPR